MMRFLSCNVRSGLFLLFCIMLGTIHRYRSTSNFALGRNGNSFTVFRVFGAVKFYKNFISEYTSYTSTSSVYMYGVGLSFLYGE